MRGLLTAVRLAVLACPAMSCFGAADYHCTADDDCIWGDRRGTCEANDYCSYPDGECPSGAKYSDQAGDLAGKCVDAPVADDGTGTDATSSTASPTSSGAGDTTGTTPPMCGNAVPEPGERCDDGNDIDGDGCNVDCMPSGVPRWDPPARVHSGGVGANTRFWDVDVRDDGMVIAVGLEDVFDQDALFVRYDEAGETSWTRYFDSGNGDDIARAVTLAIGADIFVAGHSPNPTATEGWLGLVDPADGAVDEFTWTEQAFSLGIAPMDPSRIIVAGSGNGQVGARAFTELLVPAWIAETAVAEASIAAVAADGVRDIAYAAGTFSGAARVMRLVPDDPAPLVTLFDGPLDSIAQGLEFRDGVLVVGGYVTSVDRDGWVQALTSAGAPAWSWTSGVRNSDEVEDIAIAATGDVIAVGLSYGVDQDVAVWKLSPAGELVWTWTWDEPLAGDDVARGVAVRTDGDVFVVGSLTGDDGATDAWVVRLTP